MDIVDTLTELTKYAAKGKAREDGLYLRNEAIKSKRNYEELYYKARGDKGKSSYIDMLERKLNRPGVDREDPIQNLKPTFAD